MLSFSHDIDSTHETKSTLPRRQWASVALFVPLLTFFLQIQNQNFGWPHLDQGNEYDIICTVLHSMPILTLQGGINSRQRPWSCG